MNILWDADPAAADRYRFALGNGFEHLTSASVVARAIHENPEISQIVIGPEVPLDQACDLAESARIERPAMGVILLRHRLDVTAMSQALRSGVREVVQVDDQAALGDALRRSRDLTSRLAGHLGGGPGGGVEGHVITVFSAKGGVGKTTLSTNLATYLASTGHSTLLIDLDLAFGDVGISLQLLPVSSVFDAVSMAGHLDEQGLSSLVTRHQDGGLAVVCAPPDPAQADRVPAAVITELIRLARRHYEYVLIDTPPAFTEHVLAAVDLSDLLVLIATLDIPAVKNLKVALDTLDALGVAKEVRTVVLNRADAKVGLRPEDVVTAIKTPLASNIPASSTVPASINRGVPLVLDQPKDPVSLALRELADRHIRQRFGAEVGRDETRRGLFRSRR